MGYQDRDYFRDEQSPYLELIRSTRISWGLFLLIFLGFCLCWITSQSPKPWLEYLRLDPSAMLHGWQWYRLVTACFASISFWHVLFAALLIWLSGHEVEERVGRLEFFLFVMVVGMLSNFVITAYYLTSVPGGIPPATGPAGLAIALFAWWAALDPRRPMQYFFIPMPLGIMAALMLVIELLVSQQSFPWPYRLVCHLPGLVFALLYATQDWRLSGWSRWLKKPNRASRRLVPQAVRVPAHARVQLEDRTSEQRVPICSVDEQLEAKLDDLLEKVSQSGLSSLTEEERITLQRASEVIKRRKGVQ